MRNQPKPLNRDDAARAYSLKEYLEGVKNKGNIVTLNYVKRDGKQSTSTGEVGFFSGRDGMDTMSVTIADPSKGMRTINLKGVIDATDTPK